jgi:penicillin G amidase
MSGRVMAIARALVLSLPIVLGISDSDAAEQGFTTLHVDGAQVRIYRDEHGVPHIFAETNRALFVAYGHAVAEDRLWQLELFRRAARGRLAEILGAASVTADRNARTLGFTDDELDAQFARLTAEEQEIFTAYVEGINRYLSEVVALDPANKLPFEFHVLQIGVPAMWTVRDEIAVVLDFARRFGRGGGQELANQTLLSSLISLHCEGALTCGPAEGIFNDLRWLNDPDAPVSVPSEGAFGKRQKALPLLHPDQLLGASATPPETLQDEAEAILESLGIPRKLGSHGWVVSAAKSAEGFAMLFGGPQVAFDTPALMHEVQLTGGNAFHVTGMAIAGLPFVVIGRTDHIAWTTTSAAADNTDIYIEKLCGAGTGYKFNSVCTPFEIRLETIGVKGAANIQLTVLRTVHGPVVGPVVDGVVVCLNNPSGVCHSQKQAHRERLIEDARGRLAVNRARNINEFESAIKQEVSPNNFLYADRVGNIAYWMSGQIPVRPVGFDPRLPLPGDGSAEWTDDLLPMPTSINPTRGWLANWNNKPSVDYDNPDDAFQGKYFRVLEIEARLAGAGFISLDDMRDIATDIARLTQGALPQANGGSGRRARFLKPYFLAALDVVPPGHPLASQARAVFEAWDGSAIADALTSTTLAPGEVIFARWNARIRDNTFGDELGANAGEGVANVLTHALDNALGGGSDVPPSRDYFNGSDPNAVISLAFDQALTDLGNPSSWSSQPRGTVRFRHVLFPTIPEIGTMPQSNRGTYAQIVVLRNPRITAETILPLGQSGFIQRVPPNTPVLDPFFKNQFELYRQFQYKPMPLFRNVQLQE